MSSSKLLALLITFAGPATAQLVTIEPTTLPLSRAGKTQLAESVQAGQWLAVESALFRYVGENPSSPALHKALAAAHFRNERYFLAASEYGRAARLEPLDPGSRFTLAVAYVALDRRHWARRELEALSAEYPRNPLYPYWIAGIYQHYQWFEEAILESRKAIALSPDYFMAYDRLGQCLESLGRPEEALAAYTKAVELGEANGDPSPWPSYHRGSLLRQNGRFAEALPSLERAAALDPNRGEVQHELAVTLENLNRPAAALAAMETAVRLDPANPKFQYALSRLRRRMGDMEGALASLERFERLSKGQP